MILARVWTLWYSSGFGDLISMILALIKLMASNRDVLSVGVFFIAV